MLTDRDRLIALVNNLSEWEWELFPTYKIDRETSEALVKFFWETEQGKNTTRCLQDDRQGA